MQVFGMVVGNFVQIPGLSSIEAKIVILGLADFRISPPLPSIFVVVVVKTQYISIGMVGYEQAL